MHRVFVMADLNSSPKQDFVKRATHTGTDRMGELRVATLRGQFLTYVARGDASTPLRVLEKTTRTYLRKELISTNDLAAILDQAEATGVTSFKGWRDYGERAFRFQRLRDAVG